MSPSRLSPRAAVFSGVSATALLAVTGLLAAAPSYAEALVPPTIGCPAAVGAVSYPVASPRIAESSVDVTITAGTLPAGLTLSSDVEGSFITGKPEVAGAATITLHGVVNAGPNKGAMADMACTITVREAPEVSRIAGADRYAQAIAVAEQNFTEVSTVFVANGVKFADALSATAIAADNEAPILLTQAATLPAAVAAEITKLDPENVVVVGGEASVSAGVLAALEAATDADVTRIGGADRYEVSRNLITNEAFGIAESEEVFLATGANFPDALTASPAAAVTDAPVMLVPGAEAALTTAEAAVVDGLGVKEVFLAGGQASVSQALETELAKTYDVTRHAGVDRYDVGQTINGASFATADTIYLASGVAFADALSGGVVAGMTDSPLYVTRSCVSNPLWFEIGRLAPEKVVILGGTNTLGAELDELKPCVLDNSVR